MTTPEQIIAKIEEIEKMAQERKLFDSTDDQQLFISYLLQLKQTAIEVFNLPTADSPEGSPGQSDMEG